MQARMKSPVFVLPAALKALQDLQKSFEDLIPKKTLGLVHLRTSQINGCGACLAGHAKLMRREEETDERMFTVAAWREAPFYTDAERAALALAEAVTRLSDRADPVPDDVWDEAKRHYDEPQLAALLLGIAQINVWNRLNVSTKQVAGKSW